jgi:hypothetical protein
MKLDAGQKNLLRLVEQGGEADGWTPVSAAVMPVARNQLPPQLVTLEDVGTEGRGRVKLTALGVAVIAAMEWL